MSELKLTASLEDYLEAVYEIIEEKQGVRASGISQRLGVARSSVTEALKLLATKGYINYGRYDVISLTDLGEKKAKAISEKHKTLYGFLSKILGVEDKEANLTACKIEHVISDEVNDKLINFIKQYEKERSKKVSK